LGKYCIGSNGWLGGRGKGRRFSPGHHGDPEVAVGVGKLTKNPVVPNSRFTTLNYSKLATDKMRYLC